MNILRIQQANNGFILLWHGPTDDPAINENQRIVIEDRDDEKECMRSMLYAVADHFGLHYDKWAKDNLSITFDKKGHKYED